MAKGGDTPERLAMDVGAVSHGPNADGIDAAGLDAAGIDAAGHAADPAAGHAGGDRSRGNDGRDAPADTAAPRIWPWAVALAVALVAVATFVVTRPGTPVVTAGTLFGEPVPAVPDAPTYQVARRWFEELPPDTRLTGVAIHGDLAVVHVRPVAPAPDPRSSTVLAFDTVTGELAWTTPLAWPGQVDARRPEPEPPVVVLVDDGAPTALGDWASAAAPTAGIVALSPDDGTVAWTRILPDPAQVRVFPDRGRATIRTVDWARTSDDAAGERGDTVVDLADGEVVFQAAGPLVPRDGGWFGLDLERMPREWAVLDDDGATVLRIASESAPVMLGDVVVTTRPTTDPGAPDTQAPDADPDADPDAPTADGTMDGASTTVTATALTGDVAWQATLPGTDPIPATDVYVAVGDIGDGTLLAGAYRQSDNEVGRLQDYVTSRIFPDGRIEELADELLRDRALEMGVTTITVDGTAVLACAADPGNPSAACPASLALFDLDGTVTARVDDLVLLDGLAGGIALPGIATAAGLVVAEPDALRLRGWDDLAPVWQVELPSGLREPVVATSGTGVVVGLQGPSPSITWLS